MGSPRVTDGPAGAPRVITDRPLAPPRVDAFGPETHVAVADRRTDVAEEVGHGASGFGGEAPRRERIYPGVPLSCVEARYAPVPAPYRAWTRDKGSYPPLSPRPRR